MAEIALAVDVYDRTHSSAWVGALLAGATLSSAFVAIACGPLVDRFSRRKVMIVSDLFRALVFSLPIFIPSAPFIVVVATLAGGATGLFRPALYAALPALVGEEALPEANSLYYVVDNVTGLVGPLAGGALAASVGPHPAYLVNSLSFIVSAYLLARIREERLQMSDLKQTSAGHIRDLRAGFSVFTRSRELKAAIITSVLVLLTAGAVNASEVSLAKSSLKIGSFGYGVMVSAAGFGLFIGALLAPALLRLDRFPLVYSGGIFVIATGTAVVALLPPLPIVLTMLVFSGVGNSLFMTANPLLIQRGVADAYRGRVLTIFFGTGNLILGLSFVGAGFITDVSSPTFVWALAGAIIFVAGVVGYVLTRPIDITRVESLAPGEVIG